MIHLLEMGEEKSEKGRFLFSLFFAISPMEGGVPKIVTQYRAWGLNTLKTIPLLINNP